MQRSRYSSKGLMMLVANGPTVASIVPFWKPLEQGASGAKSGGC